MPVLSTEEQQLFDVTMKRASTSSTTKSATSSMAAHLVTVGRWQAQTLDRPCLQSCSVDGR